MYRRVSSVCKSMVAVVGAVDRVDYASPLLFVGHRDWEKLDRWEKINVSSTAFTLVSMRMTC